MEMSKSILITRPNYEKVTSYLFAWSEAVVKLARDKVYAVHDLQRDKAIRKTFESYVNSHKPAFIFMNGHGNSEEITGHDDEVLVDSSTSLKGSIIYARSCDAGQKLGPILVENGAEAFIGYSRKFVFGYLPEKMVHPLDDSLASYFLESSNLVPLNYYQRTFCTRSASEVKRQNVRKFQENDLKCGYIRGALRIKVVMVEYQLSSANWKCQRESSIAKHFQIPALKIGT